MHFVRSAVRGGRRQKMIKQCACCGKEFNAKYKEAKYCSRECSHKACSAFAKERNTKRKQEALEKKAS